MLGKSAVLLGVLAATASATPILVTSLAGLGQNDSASWAQLGADQTNLGSTFSATSVGGKAIGGSFSSAGSFISVVCPSNPACSWIASGPGLAAGDSLIVTANGNGGATGPLTLTFPSVFGAGLWMQVDAPGPFTAQMAVYNGATLLTTLTEVSNSSGDPVFIGALDTTADITKVVVNLSACAGLGGGLGCNTNDFAADTLFLQGAAVTGTPEPVSFLLFGGGFAALIGWRARMRLGALVARKEI